MHQTNHGVSHISTRVEWWVSLEGVGNGLRFCGLMDVVAYVCVTGFLSTGRKTYLVILCEASSFSRDLASRLRCKGNESIAKRSMSICEMMAD